MTASVEVLWSQWIPLRDGERLSARHYRPRGAGALPVIVTQTPYGSDHYHDRAMFFARQGYAFALVDCRGRGDSTGDFVPELIDYDDGYDMVEWLAAQPWCDGQVAMWGGSYSGENQWNTLLRRPPHLRTIAPAAATYTPADYPFRGPIRSRYMLQWLALVSGRSASPFNLFADPQVWIDAYTAHYRSGRPFAELEAFCGKSSRFFNEYVSHPAHDPYWNQYRFAVADFAGFDIPILTIAGQYDDSQRGSLFYLAEHERAGTPGGVARHYAVIGPWDHGGTRTAQTVFGGATFGKAAALDLNRLHLDWYDWTLRGGARPVFLQDRIAYYVTGAEEWRYAPAFDAISDRAEILYLGSAGRAGAINDSGRLTPTPTSGVGSDSYRFDPRDLGRADDEQTPHTDWLTDPRYDQDLRGNGLVYHTAPLEQDLSIAGCPRLRLWLQLDAPDADFQVTLAEIDPEGRYLKLCEDFLRARYRTGCDRELWAQPDAVEAYDFDGFTFVARRIRAGSRLRLVVRCPDSIHYQKNPQTGGDVDHQAPADGRPATIRLHHNSDHPSALTLPLAAPHAA